MLFLDRKEAGLKLAQYLAAYANRPDVIVLALPRGGVPVAFEVARQLHAPLDVFLVRKLGVPGHRELAFGAIASGGIRVLNEPVVDALGIDRETVERVAAEEQQELQRQERAYRGDLPEQALAGRIVILVDDGLATGSSMRAAVAAVRQQQPARVVVAAPVGAAATCNELQREAHEVICAYAPEGFLAVGQWYWDFSQVTDEEVRRLLQEANRNRQKAA